MVAGLCHFVFSSFHVEKTPREETKGRHAKRRNNAIRKDETRHAKRRNFSVKRRKKCEKTPFNTLILSSFRVASFHLFAWGLFVFSMEAYSMEAYRDPPNVELQHS